MSWFDEQIKFRKELDSENFADAISEIAGAVMGRRLSEALSQKEIASSAISEILRYFHLRPRSEDATTDGETVYEQLDNRLRPFGIMRRTVVLESGWYRRAVGPMLGTMKESGAAVALLPGRAFGYYWTDAATGKRVRLNRKTEQLLDSEAICFYEPLPLRPMKIRDLVKYMIGQTRTVDYLLYLGAMAAVTLIGLITPMFSKWLFGSVLESGSTRVLLSLAAFMLCFSLAQMCINAFQTLNGTRLSTRISISVQAAVMNRVLTLPAEFFRDYSSGELTQRALYVQAVCSMLVSTVAMTGISSVFSLVYIGQIFAFAPGLVLPSLVITVLSAVLTLITTLAQMRITKERMLAGSKTSGLTYSMITGVQKIKLAGAEKRMFSRWARHYAEDAELEYNPPMFLKISGSINLCLTLLGTLVLYYFAIKTGVSEADYYAFSASYGMVSGAFLGLSSIAVSIANIKPALDMARPILAAAPECDQSREVVRKLRGSIELDKVSFRYNEEMPMVLDELSLKIRAGEYLAVVGTTGCGKSTLMRLLLGFEKPLKGTIYYDNKDISKLDLKSLRHRIGAVMQDSKLFLGDIFSNIAIAAPQLTLDEAWEAAEIASIADDIRAMPMGMNTFICEGQGGISGGQRQRLMIARAVAPKPSILLFDEATSALDNVTQKRVSEAIDSLHCTRIVIAHRLSTIRHCDRIIVLDHGRIAEDGTYEELIGKNGLFAELVARQRLDLDDPETAQ